ncbi:zinc finger CW-type PWWP domain protein 2 isoform X2 [Perognathus longimembris pacificus]|uniref:zinc finger CW-type PWWP domain protein 2 isoform X2 n=1 Tax=Perognathus longimembris pacificus TaxID=214514 RepID=UPI0020186F95|nr:zinc finger CW-type PWWP domain protein 2 isoform X2 [Perognathus longimembris pacificus]
MDSTVANDMFINKVWVQCENDSCLKWRLLSNEDAIKVNQNEPWYCFMNNDSRYNKCSVSEEDFPEESQLHKSGYKIVYSQLPVGSLVLVKLQKWPSWPGVLCPDSLQGNYVNYDLDGNVEQYHIEFLGDPHSKSWINARFVEHYSITSKHVFWQSEKPDKAKAATKVAMTAKKRILVSKNITEKKKPKFRKNKREAILKCSIENVCSDDALSKENMVVVETEILLKELEKMLQQALEPTTTPDESRAEREEINTGGKLSKCSPEVPESSPFQIHHENDFLVIDGIKLKAGECIEKITNKFKEIDALMSEF